MRNDERYKSYLDNTVEVPALAEDVDAGSYQVKPGEDVVLVNLPAKDSAVQTVVLPNVTEVRGKLISVYVVAAGGTGAKATVSVADTGGNIKPFGAAFDAETLDLNKKDERVLLYCDGYAYTVLTSKTDL